MACENFRSNVIGCSDGGVGHQSPRPTPVVDLGSVADSEVDLINGNRVTVARFVRSSLQQLLVVVVVVQAIETGRESEIGKLDVTSAVQQDIVGFDITRPVSFTDSELTDNV